MKPSLHSRGEIGQWHSSSERPQETGANRDRAHGQASLLQTGLITLQITPRVGCLRKLREEGFDAETTHSENKAVGALGFFFFFKSF